MRSTLITAIMRLIVVLAVACRAAAKTSTNLPVASAKLRLNSRAAAVSPRSHGAIDVAPWDAASSPLVMRGGASGPSLMYQLTTVVYFAGWYALNVKYNIVNKVSRVCARM